ncbi:MAG: hypothetical protein AAF630_13015 [Cyanobacteria bacterium P01_C01_bin.38]
MYIKRARCMSSGHALAARDPGTLTHYQIMFVQNRDAPLLTRYSLLS